MDPKPFASLSAGLLARKGTARPAMRRPHMAGMPVPTLPVSVQDDDLGWNDMGEEHHAAHAPAPPLTMVGAKAVIHPGADLRPAVVMQQEKLEQSFSRVAAPQPSTPMPATPEAKAGAVVAPAPEPVAAPVKEKQSKRKSDGPKLLGASCTRAAKAAFTLRLDPDRHLRLRLACAVDNRSAQQIVTQALDAFLDSQPQLEALARQVPQGGAKGRETN